MGQRALSDPFGGAAITVDDLLGNAYDTVRFVAQNVEYIKHVSAHLPNIYEVSEHVDAINTINTNIPYIIEVIGNIDEINAIAQLSVIQFMPDKIGDVTYETLTALAEGASNNEKAAIKRLFEAGGTMPFRSMTDAQVTSIPATVNRAVIDGVDYMRAASEPSHALKYRSADRWTDEGAHDSANGGWWELDEAEPTLEMGGAVGDGIVNDQAAYTKLLSYGRPITLVRGRTYLVTDPSNPNGIPLRGAGKIVTAVAGGQRQHNSYADLAPRVYFGNEYLDRCFQFLQLGQGNPSGKLNIHLFGDSTVSGGFGEYQKPEEVISAALGRLGIPNHSVSNHGGSGTTWSDLDAIPYLSAAETALFIIKYGINDAGFGFTNFVTQMRDKLAAIRAASFGSVGALSIILVGPTGTSDSPNSRDERWYEMINGAIRQAAREFQCAFFDGYAFMRDARGAAGVWMDDPYSDGRAVHPINGTNARLWGGVMQAFFAPAMLAPFAANNLVNESDVSSKKLPADAPSTYEHGVSLHRAVASDGWPIDGVVVTHRNVGGPAMQYLYGYAADATRIMTRIANFSGDSWNLWTGERVALTLQNGWVNYGGSLAGAAARIVSGGLVILEGVIKNGNQAGGTVLANLPAGMRPAAEVLCTASVYATNAVATIRIKPNGDIVGDLGLASGLTSLCGICFMAA